MPRRAAVLGIDAESPAAVAAAVAVSLALAVGLWLLNRRWLALWLSAFGVVFAVFDIAEISHQLDESRTGLAVLAAVIAAVHLAAAATRRAVRPTGAAVVTSPIDVVQRVIDEVMNGRDHDLLDELCTPALAPKLRAAFSSFLAAFPDWHQEAREFVSDGRTVVARMRCTGTHRGDWQGLAPPADG